MSYNVKGNVVWLHGTFFSFTSSVFIPCCKQSSETGSKSSFSSITGFECDFKCLLMWEWHTSVFHHSSSPSVIYTFCVLCPSLSPSLSLLNASHSLGMNWMRWKLFIEALRGCRCLTEMRVKQSQNASFHSDILFFFFPLRHTVWSLIKNKKHTKKLCVVPTALKWLHREHGGGKEGI